MEQDGKKEKTLVIIKPDGIQRSLVGELIKRYERSGLKLVGLKMFVPTDAFIEQHYSLDPDWKMKAGEKAIAAYDKKGIAPPSREPLEVGEKVLRNLKKYLSSGPVVTMVWQGMHAVEIVRKITGGTEPLTSDVGTIRGDLTIDSYAVADTGDRAVRNLIHASGSHEEAQKEIPLWFKAEELINYRLLNESILYDVNLGGILE
ncbi:nucleoside-diphosphate kinase [Candidatus Wolfebacteria bacterium]|nr:nucleoside-diphosphate kinase [Candidatus Wolfebacteria bacterium]